jgi:hypothetical protein
MSDASAPVEYTAEQLAAAQQLVDFDRAKKAAELNARRAAYLVAVNGLVASSEWSAVRERLTQISGTNEADGLLSFHVSALVEIIGRLEKTATQNRVG